jgi:hypothetical protein
MTWPARIPQCNPTGFPPRLYYRHRSREVPHSALRRALRQATTRNSIQDAKPVALSPGPV